MDYSFLSSQGGGRMRREAQQRLQPYHRAHQRRKKAALSDGTCAEASRTNTATAAAITTTASTCPCWAFYRGYLPASPGKECVTDLLQWSGMGAHAAPVWCPEVLERRHDYIQWLFPLRERGVNSLAPLLTDKDATKMVEDGIVMTRILSAVRMMLRFFGIQILLHVAEEVQSTAASSSSIYADATLQRTPSSAECQSRYANLCCRQHNCLRISRLLQFLGEMRLEPLKVGLLEYLLREVVDDSVGTPLAHCKPSLFFWMEIPYEEEDRVRLQRLVVQLSATHQTSSSASPVVKVHRLQLPPATELSQFVSATSAQEVATATPDIVNGRDESIAMSNARKRDRGP